MSKTTSPEGSIYHFGLKPDNPFTKRVDGAYLEIIELERAGVFKKEPLAKLSEQEDALLQESQKRTIKYLSEKITNMELTPEQRVKALNHLRNLPPVRYIEPLSGDKASTDGYWRPKLNIVAVTINPKKNDMLNTAITQAHELSHASADSETRVYWSDTHMIRGTEIPVFDKVVSVGGIETVGNKNTKAAGIENGLAIMDSVEIYNKCLTDIYPEEHKRRIQKKRAFTTRIGWDTDFGKIPDEDFLPFIQSRKIGLPKMGLAFDFTYSSVPAFRYQFIKELCKTIGYSHTPPSERATVTTQDFIALGRKILDRDRYIRDHSGLRAVVDTYGGKDAKLLFEVDDGEKNLKQAMKIVKEKERELGIIPSKSSLHSGRAGTLL